MMTRHGRSSPFPAMFYLTFGLKFPTSAALSEHWLAAVPVIAGPRAGRRCAVSPPMWARSCSPTGKRACSSTPALPTAVPSIGTFIFAFPLGLIGMVQAYLVVATIMHHPGSRLICHKLRLPYRLLAKGLLPGLLATLLWGCSRFGF